MYINCVLNVKRSRVDLTLTDFYLFTLIRLFLYKSLLIYGELYFVLGNYFCYFTPLEK